MKTSTIYHRQEITEYSLHGIICHPDAKEKLLISLFNPEGYEVKSFTVDMDLETVQYKTKKELDAEFWRVVDKYKDSIQYQDMHIR